jgi:hypothetical protein
VFLSHRKYIDAVKESGWLKESCLLYIILKVNEMSGHVSVRESTNSAISSAHFYVECWFRRDT